MIKTKVIKTTVEDIKVTALICNKCNKHVTDSIDDMIERQEFFSYRSMGGYGAVFGDSVEYRIDLCQSCMKELLEPYVEYLNLE